MFFKRSAALAACTLLGATSALAQTVTLYGALDVGVERLTNVNANGDSTVRMPSQTGGIMPSRWGFRGSEDLGDGLKVLFNLEAGFAADKGANNPIQGGRIFGRSAWVGLSGNWGTLTLGRQYTMYFYSLLDTDFLGPSVYGLSSLDFGIPGARADNAVSYRGSWGNFAGGVLYSLGRDALSCAGETSGDTKNCRQHSAYGKYDDATWGIAVAHDEQRGGTGGAAGFTSSSRTDRRNVVAANLKFGAAKIGVGLVKRNFQAVTTSTVTPRSDLAYLQVLYRVSPSLVVDGVLSQLKYNDSVDGSKARLYALRATYSLSKRTALYATGGRIQNKGSANLALSLGTTPADQVDTRPGAGNGQSGVMVGIRHSF